jgi:hypothetical protein
MWILQTIYVKIKIEDKIMYFQTKKPIDETFKVIKATPANINPSPEPENVSSIEFNGKTLIILCGNNTRSNSRASYYAHTCFSWMKDFDEVSNLTAYSLYYPSTSPLKNSFTPDYTLDYDSLAYSMFGSILSNETLSPDDISKKFRDIVFFGHSIGGFVMNELMYSLTKILFSKNFSDEEVQKILNSIVFISYSPQSLVEAPIQNICIAPVYDSMGSTKLAYEKMAESEDFVSSFPDLDMNGKDKITSITYSDFFKRYRQIMENEDVITFCNKNNLIITPNLLYQDGISEEDHNLAGVIDNHSLNPYKTQAGKITTEFMRRVFEYALSSKIKKFNLPDLYHQLMQNPKFNPKAQATHKEKL